MKRTLLTGVVVLLACGLYAALAIYSMQEKSLTLDETVYIPAGTLMVDKGDYSYNPEQPPVPKLMAGWANRSQKLFIPEPFSLKEFIEQNSSFIELWTITARLPMVGLGVLTLLGIFLLANKVGGRAAGAFAIFLAALSPNLLAHGRLVTGDLPLACFVVWMSFFFLRFADSRKFIDLFGLGIFFGLAMGSKFTAVLFPIFFLVAEVFYGVVYKAKNPDQAATVVGKSRWVGLISLDLLAASAMGGVVLWALYGFSYGPVMPLLEPELLTELGVGDDGGVFSFVFSRYWPAPHLWHGLLKTIARGGGEYAYLLGNISYEGWWYYYPACLLVKTPLTVFLALGAFLLFFIKDIAGTASKQNHVCESGMRGKILCLVLVAGTLGFFMTQKIDLGYRYLLGMTPVLYVMAGVGTLGLWNYGRLGKIVASLVLAGQLLAAGMIHPHYLAYFNPIAGGPDGGHRWLVDSNLDWGQDLPALRKFMETTKVDTIYFGTSGNVDPDLYSIRYHLLPSPFFNRNEVEGDIPGCGPVRGWVAVGATTRAGVYLEPTNCYQWLRAQQPWTTLGHSIFVYYIE